MVRDLPPSHAGDESAPLRWTNQIALEEMKEAFTFP